MFLAEIMFWPFFIANNFVFEMAHTTFLKLSTTFLNNRFKQN